MLNIHYLSYGDLSSLDSNGRVSKILPLLRNGNVVIIDHVLHSKDEALLIRETMNSIDEDFNGMEIGVLRDNVGRNLLSKLRHRLAKYLVGDRTGITLIGPAKIISELRQHPENIELHFNREYLKKHSAAKK
ncbi:MAG TPA: DUF2073 domain-containing protein [Alphaproteobacteria bacterium]|nr:DUF2073 domain-containing protein [Alphaproteobacteria bacterium]